MMLPIYNSIESGPSIGNFDDMPEYYHVVFWFKNKEDKEKNNTLTRAGKKLKITDLGYSIEGNSKTFYVWDYDGENEVTPTAESLGLPKPPFVGVFLSPKHPLNTDGSEMSESSFLSTIKFPTTDKVNSTIETLDKIGKDLKTKKDGADEIKEASKGFLPDWFPDLGFNNGFLNLPDLNLPKNIKAIGWGALAAFSAYQTVEKEENISKAAYGSVTIFAAIKLKKVLEENEDNENKG